MKTKHDGKQISPGSIKQMQEKGVKIMYRKEKKMAAKKAGSLLTGGVLMAALALGQISPAMVYAEDGETSLSVAEAQAEEEQGAEEKAEYTQLETTNISYNYRVFRPGSHELFRRTSADGGGRSRYRIYHRPGR